MVHIRRVPVVVAGRGLTPVQVAIAALGSHLVLPPWWRDKDDPVTSLAVVNLAFYAMSCMYWGCAVAVLARTATDESVEDAAFNRATWTAVNLLIWLFTWFVLFSIWELHSQRSI